MLINFVLTSPGRLAACWLALSEDEEEDGSDDADL